MKLALAIGSLCLVGFGTWWIYPPAALIVVGALIWMDLCITDIKHVPRSNPRRSTGDRH